MELLVVVAITGVLTVLLAAAWPRGIAEANRADSSSRLRALGQAIFLYTGDHEGKLPGPLWPGQVLLYDPARDGRIVRDLAAYLDIEQRANAYVVDKMFPRAYRENMPPGSPGDARVYVVNPGWIDSDGQTIAPFGSTTSTPTIGAMKIAQLNAIPETNGWMIAEADQQQAYVSTAPWKANTPARPLHDGYRATVRFDGSVNFEKAN